MVGWGLTVFILVVLRRINSLVEGDGERVRSWFPSDGPSCPTVLPVNTFSVKTYATSRRRVDPNCPTFDVNPC